MRAPLAVGEPTPRGTGSKRRRRRAVASAGSGATPTLSTRPPRWREAGSLAEPSAELSDGSGRPGALDAVRWLNLRELYGAPHRWPGGRASHLYAYEHHAVELHDEAAQMGQVVQGGVGNCYFLSAVAAAMGDLDVRRDMIDESLEEAGIYGRSLRVADGVGRFIPLRTSRAARAVARGGGWRRRRRRHGRLVVLYAH